MREKPKDKERLMHILDAINKIENFINGVSEKRFYKNTMIQYAVIKSFEIMGEAAYMTTKELRRNYKKIDWKSIIIFRHILVHDYYKINIEIVWKAIDKLPKLEKQIVAILKELNN